MAPRADSLADLRALDRRLSEVEPGPHLERQILARLRGEAAPSRGLGLRARRPALVLSFALAAAATVMLGMEAREVSPVVPPSAAGPSAPEARDLHEALPEEDAAEPSAPSAPAVGEKERAPRSLEEDGTRRRRAPEMQPSPTLRDPVRPRSPRSLEAPDAAEGPVNSWPSAPEGGPPAKPDSAPRAPGIAPTGSYGSMLYPQGLGSDGPESRRFFGPRRSGSASPGGPEAPAVSEEPPAIPWKAPEEAPSVCEGYATWKEVAHAECEADGLTLVNLVMLDACGEGMFEGVEAVCAAPAKDPSEEPPPSYCVGMPVGDGATCEPPEHFKQAAVQSCSAEGLILFELYLSQDCGDGLSTAAKALCCGDPPPPDPTPAPPPCVTFEMAPACSPASEVEAEAKAQCASKGLTASEMKLITDCPNGGISYAAILCCSK